MNDSIPLCTELYDILVRTPQSTDYRFTFAPGDSGVKERFLTFESAGAVETVCFSKTFLTIFHESHKFFTQYQSVPGAKAKTLYFVSVGLLLTTPENRTALNLHETKLLELLRSKGELYEPELLRNEIIILERFLTSNNNRLNKSSSLWCLYRKLVILSRERNSKEREFVPIFIQSATRHFANYYCWTTVRWYFDVSSLAEKDTVLEATQVFCFKNLKDPSAWSALSYMICQENQRNNFNINDYKRLKANLKLTDSNSTSPCWLSFDVIGLIRRLVKMVDNVAVEEWPPFLCLLEIARQFSNIIEAEFFSKWSDDIMVFEEQHTVIRLLRNNPVVPQELSDDALLSRTVKHLGYKKLFLRTFRNSKRYKSCTI